MLCDKRSRSGIQTNDLDAYIKFDFPYPSTVRDFEFTQPPQAAETVHTGDVSPEIIVICVLLPPGAAAETQNNRHQEHQLARWDINMSVDLCMSCL